MKDDVARYVRACRMAANESARLYKLGGVSLDRLTDLVRDVGSLERMVDALSIGERDVLNRQLQQRAELRRVFSDVMALRNRSAELKVLSLAISVATAGEDGPEPAASVEPLSLHMPPRDD